jgi:hypothetical protein
MDIVRPARLVGLVVGAYEGKTLQEIQTAQPSAWRVTRSVTISDIATHHICRLPAAVVHDREFRWPLAVALGRESRSKRMSGEGPLEADISGTTFDRVDNCSIAQTS